MAISPSLSQFLFKTHTNYELINHQRTMLPADSARSANISMYALLKGLILMDGQGFCMAVIPVGARLDLHRVQKVLGRPLALASEDEFQSLFDDCDAGAVPALGQAFTLPVIWDENLQNLSDCYFESGDHRQLVHISGSEFERLMHGHPFAAISHFSGTYPPSSAQSDLDDFGSSINYS